jgi:DNA helicase-2/ATP-dependent DNA helicase PcrA
MDNLIESAASMLVLSGQKEIVRALRAFWGRRYPLWEGHTREPLAALVTTISNKSGDARAIAEAVVEFLEAVSVGFTRTSHGNRLTEEIARECAKPARGKPAYIQELARCILAEPTHVGVAKCLKRLTELVYGKLTGFDSIAFDLRNELRDATRLGEFAEATEGFSEINRKRSFARPMPPSKAISTIHKAKGLECDHSMIVPCDSQNFSNTAYARCKLYVALSRAKRTATLIVSRNKPSPLVTFGKSR